jgi:hypothetical protein
VPSLLLYQRGKKTVTCTHVVRDVAALIVDLYTKIKYLRTEVVWSCGSIPQYLIFHYSTHANDVFKTNALVLGFDHHDSS